MKNWRKIRNSLTNIFDTDTIRYDKSLGCFFIFHETFIMEEMLHLSKLCENYKLWFYINAVHGNDVIITVEDKP